MDLPEITNKIKGRVGEDSGLDATVKFDMGDEGVVFVDATKTPNEVNNENVDADCTIILSVENMNAIMSNELDPVTAFMMGKLKVEGSMGIAMKIQSVL
jgi:putative sterol carrier protein